MSLGTATEEVARSDELWKSTGVVALREQQEKDFGIWGPYEFKMPQTEGEWASVTTNSGRILANKIIGLLSSSWLQLYIDVSDDVRKGRQKIANTEQLANGCIWSADREAISVPSGKKLQSALAFWAVVRGGTAESVYWYEGKEGKPVCDIKVYDPMYCQWLEGDREVLWFCYRNWVSKHFLEHAYKKKIGDGFSYGNPNQWGKYLTRTFWDDEKWKVEVNGEYIDEYEHRLGYIPVNIRSCGSAPYVQSEEYQDTMKWSWQSFALNTRNVYELESKLLSIESSKAIDSGRKDVIGRWDSVKSGNVPPDFTKVAYGTGQRNNFLFLDTAKGQDFIGFAEAPGNEVIDAFHNRVDTKMDVMATMDPIAAGHMGRSGSGALASILMDAALEFMDPYRECVENDFIWMAEECVRQFKEEKMGKVELEGRNRAREKFSVELKPEDVEEKHFDCELVIDKLRDGIQELGAAIQAVTYGLKSRKTAMADHNIVRNPDKEMDNIEEELASQDPVFRARKLAKYFHDQGEDDMALYWEAVSAITIKGAIEQAMMAGLMPGTPGEGEQKPSIVSPQMETGNIASQPRGSV